MPASSQTIERRRAVRLRPLPELPVTAHLLGPEERELGVIDVSVGGIAFAADSAPPALERGSTHRVRLDLGRYGAFELSVEVRHRGGDAASTVGVMMIEPPADAVAALGRYVAELLERGAPS